MLALNGREIFIAAKPIDLRMSMNSLASMIESSRKSYLHDGSVYVFYNKDRNKIKCMFWDKNGFVLYYKKLESTKFRFKNLSEDIESITPAELEQLLSGFEPLKQPTKVVIKPKKLTSVF